MNETVFWDALRAYNATKKIDPRVVEWANQWPDKAMAVACATNCRNIEVEPMILESVKNGSVSFYNVINYCNKSLKGRWLELEALLLDNPSSENIENMIAYAQQVVSKRWVECEQFIKEPLHIIKYAQVVIKDRWKEKESLIIKSDPSDIYNYCTQIISRFNWDQPSERRWIEAENILINSDYHNKDSIICNYASYVIRGRWKEAEEIIKNNPTAAYHYAISVINGRWPEGEEAIAKQPSIAYAYAENVLKGAFPAAESSLLDSKYYFDYFTFATASTRKLVHQLANQFDPNMTVAEILQKVNDGRSKKFEEKLLNSTHNQKKAVWYATNVLKGRWTEAEDIIKKSAKWSVAYARDVIKGRWEDGEKSIAKDPKYLAQYGLEVIKDQLPPVLHNTLMAEKLKGNDNSNITKYFEMLE